MIVSNSACAFKMRVLITVMMRPTMIDWGPHLSFSST